MRILALVEAVDHVCYRYRIAPFEPWLERAGWIVVPQVLSKRPLERALQLQAAADYDCVLLQRKLLSHWHFRILRKYSKRLVFDFDDAVAYRDSNDARGPICRRRARRFSRIVRASDLVIAGNSFLVDLAVSRGADRSRVVRIPTCVEPGRYSLPASRTHDYSIVDLVWIGSASTLRGLNQRRALWERLGEVTAPSRLRLRIVSDQFAKFDPLEVVPVRWSEQSEADELIRSDVGVSWVPDDLWSKGKCGLKVLQYQAAGLPVIANPVGVHPEMVIPGITGCLAESDSEWVEAVNLLAQRAPALEHGRSWEAPGGRALFDRRLGQSICRGGDGLEDR